jgi:putative flippase GtrA
MKKIVISRQLMKNVVLYGIIGACSAMLDVGVFTLLHSVFNVNPIVSNVISVHCGIGSSFYFNRKYNFKKKDKVALRALSFYLTGLFGLLLSTGILALGMYLGAHVTATKIFSTIVVAGVQFVINKLVSFGRIGETDG